MKVIKLLERKEVIRLFGGGLMLAPVFNSYLTFLALKSEVPGSGLQAFWKVVVAGTTAQHVLDIASILIGCLMLTGLRAAWKLMLVLLGGYMALQLTNLGKNIRTNPLNGLFFIANVGIFLFVADQLAFKQKAKSPAAGASPNPPKKSQSPAFSETETLPTKSVPSLQVVPLKVDASEEAKKVVKQSPPAIAKTVSETRKSKARVRRSHAKILVHFHGVGAWAQVVSISAIGIELKSSGPAPLYIESREVEMNLTPELLVKARLKSRQGSLYFFEYTELPQSRIPALNQWLLAQAS